MRFEGALAESHRRQIALGEEQAGAENLGVWAGNHQRPWEYRQQK